MELLQERGFILDSARISRYEEAFKAYEDNFSGFLGVVNGSSLEEKAREAANQAEAQGYKDEKLNYRAEYFQYLLRNDRLSRN
ncbi:hypothetical protein [Simkania sp.]|uniref:hypothetical protein n=1 Tax=Simkania sp. TaxID=34094 RepID=UPI003B521BBA